MSPEPAGGPSGHWCSVQPLLRVRVSRTALPEGAPERGAVRRDSSPLAWHRTHPAGSLLLKSLCSLLHMASTSLLAPGAKEDSAVPCRFFFSTVASATAGMLCLITILLYILVQYFVNPGVLRTDPNYEDVKNTNTWLLFLPLFPVQVQTLIVVIIGMVVLLLDLLGLVQLGQLLIFHIYLKAKKMTTFEYLIKTRGEESSEHQAARNDPCAQMEEGFLQQRDGALGLSGQGAKVKSCLLIYKSPCHFCTSVNPDGDSSAKEADDAPSPSSLGLQQERRQPLKTNSAESED
ncbi:PREDICTED: probable palmitoyltransferase ZDHHC11 [Colobus angolensis palliatus]|uniref:probable palmitoyltransferase ZDHHC11 n=1 Tax=Colobus angolensis palliatus TaxID=336983 RepID=UPI0005F42ABD|nr:PREDICTED: probable palmitoyltransferase ZDHHC11 [Colobus angolensis palliatus]